MQKTIVFLLLILTCLSLGFYRPGTKKYQARKRKLNLQQIQHEKKLESKKHYTAMNIAAGSLNYSDYSTSQGYYGLEYSIINEGAPTFRISIGTGTNKNDVGNKIQTIPLDIDIIFTLQGFRGYDFSAGIGINYTTLNEYINQAGLGYHWLLGLSYNISPTMAIFTGYKNKYLTTNGTNLNSNLLQFGFSFKFLK